MKGKIICFTCRKAWEEDRKDFPPHRVIYTFCGVCRYDMLREFERQFTKKVLHFPSKEGK